MTPLIQVNQEARPESICHAGFYGSPHARRHGRVEENWQIVGGAGIYPCDGVWGDLSPIGVSSVNRN